MKYMPFQLAWARLINGASALKELLELPTTNVTSDVESACPQWPIFSFEKLVPGFTDSSQ